MTDQELIDYYANLLILQYLEKPNAFATIQALVTPVIMDQLPTSVMNAFDLSGVSTAVGKQLDVLGKYAGVTRNGYGFEGQPIALDDDDFLSLIKLAVVKNTSGSSLADIQSLIAAFFAGQMLVFDYKNMQMNYMVSSSVGSQELLQLFVTQGLLPRPMAVAVALLIYAPIIDAFFGFRTYTLPGQNNSPFNSYADYQTGRPWLSYTDAIIL